MVAINANRERHALGWQVIRALHDVTPRTLGQDGSVGCWDSVEEKCNGRLDRTWRRRGDGERLDGIEVFRNLGFRVKSVVRQLEPVVKKEASA